jgi:type VI secretion system protein ImpA
MLDKICEYFNRYEPSSPVPFLLKRARNLVNKNFMAILNDLAPGGTDQANLVFGIQGENSE